MHNPHDRFAKKLVQATLEPRGAYTSEMEVSPDAQRFDGYFVPKRTLAASHLDLLERLAIGPSAFESFRRAPTSAELVECVRKVLNARHVFGLAKPKKPQPYLWNLCGGDPRAGLAAIGATQKSGFPRGVYAAPPGLHTGVVVLSQLPETPDTLLLRLMGAGRTRQRALDELARLPNGARARGVALPVLVQCRVEIIASDTRTPDDEEFLMQTQSALEQIEGEARVKGHREMLLAVYRARFGAVPRKVRAAIERASDEAMLIRYGELFATREAEEIAAALAPNKG